VACQGKISLNGSGKGEDWGGDHTGGDEKKGKGEGKGGPPPTGLGFWGEGGCREKELRAGSRGKGRRGQNDEEKVSIHQWTNRKDREHGGRKRKPRGSRECISPQNESPGGKKPFKQRGLWGENHVKPLRTPKTLGGRLGGGGCCGGRGIKVSKIISGTKSRKKLWGMESVRGANRVGGKRFSGQGANWKGKGPKRGQTVDRENIRIRKKNKENRDISAVRGVWSS